MGKSRLVVAVCLTLAAAASAPAVAGVVLVPRPRVYDDFVEATANPRDDAQVTELWQQAEHVLEPHDPVLARHTLVVTRATVDRLRRAGIDVTIEATSVQQMVD